MLCCLHCGWIQACGWKGACLTYSKFIFLNESVLALDIAQLLLWLPCFFVCLFFCFLSSFIFCEVGDALMCWLCWWLLKCCFLCNSALDSVKHFLGHFNPTMCWASGFQQHCPLQLCICSLDGVIGVLRNSRMLSACIKYEHLISGFWRNLINSLINSLLYTFHFQSFFPLTYIIEIYEGDKTLG